MNYGQLATTGTGALMIGSVAVNQMWLLAAATALVGAGALALKLGWRHGKAANEL